MQMPSILTSDVDRSSKVWGMISDFKKNTENILRTNTRERSDQARGSEATERGEGVGGGGVYGREIFQFWGSESCNLVHAVMRFLTLYLIRIWIKIIPYSRTHTETGSELYRKYILKNEEKKSAKVIISIYRPVVAH